jgi:hypothetical protein
MRNPKGNPETLIPAKKGEIRNPKGNNGYLPFAKLAQQAVTNEDLKVILDKVKSLSNEGEMDAIKFLFDRIFGKVPDNMNIKHDLTIEDVREKLIARSKAKQ